MTVTQTSGTTSVSEAGTTDTFAIVLDAAPASDVVLTVDVNDGSEASVDLPTLTFTSANWNSAQIVTVTGIDDAVVDGAQTVTITVSIDATASSNEYDAVADQSISVSVADNDTASFTLVESSGTTTVSETGTTDTFTVVLGAMPSSDVVLNVNSDDASEALVIPVTLTFTSGNWSVPQTVTISGVDDALVDGTQTATITVSIDAAASSNEFDTLADQTVSVSVTDNDVPALPGVILTESSGTTSVTEAGATDDISVVLNAQPLSDVVLNVVSSDIGEAVADLATLTFTSGNWSVPQTVTISGVDDALVDGTQTATITVSVDAVASSNEYDALVDQTISVEVTDNETAGFTILESSGATIVAEPDATDAFTVVLNAMPAADVVLTVTSSNVAEATVSPATVVFTVLDWNTPQTVTVTGVDDALVDGTQTATITVAIDAVASSAEYAALADQTVSVSVADNDVPPPSYAISIVTASVSENGTTETFTVALGVAPVSDVVFNVNSNDASEALVDFATLTFTNTNWSVPQTVTITGVDDALIDGTQTATITVSIDAAASSNEFDTLADQTISVSIADNDVIPPAIIVTENGGSTSVSENGSHDKLVVVLATAPAANVVVNIVSSDTGEATVTPSSMTFTPSNWNVGQEIDVVGIDDPSVDGIQTAVITISVDDVNSSVEYTTAADQSVSVSVTDNDVASGGGGGGGGGGGVPQPAITINTPNGGEVLNAGSSKLVLWSYQGSSNHTVRLDLSIDGGATYDEVVVASAPGTGSYLWTIPDKTAISAKLRAQLLYFGSPMATDASDAVFTLIGSDAGDLPRSGSGTGTAPIFIPSASINEDKGIVASTSSTPCVSESLIRTTSQSAVYYCGANGRRYVFPNEKIYFSWYADFSHVTVVSDETMASIQIGGNVTYKPGSRMIKVESDPKTYVVSRGGQLRHVTTEAIATALYGAAWNTKIDDLPVGFFTDYAIIAPITSADLP
jgi:hypothetical protein